MPLPELPPGRRPARPSRRWSRFAAIGGAWLAAVLALACQDSVTGPATGGGHRLAILPRLPHDYLAGGFDLAIDMVHLRLARADGTVLLDSLVPFPEDSSRIQLSLDVPASDLGVDLVLLLEYLSSTEVFFRGQVGVRASTTPGAPNGPTPVPLTFVGPGANLARIRLDPRDSGVRVGDSLRFRVSGVDSTGQEVPSFYVHWSAMAPGATTAPPRISARGVVRAPSGRGSAWIRVTTPTGITDSVRTWFLPAVASQRLTAGGGSAPVQSRLPIVLEVLGADNLPEPGVSIGFGLTGDGTISATSVLTDSLGLAHDTVRLGTRTGTVTVLASTPGLPPLTIPLQTLAGPPDTLIVVAGDLQTVRVTEVAAVPLQVRVQDAFGNAAPGVTVVFTAPGRGATLEGAASRSIPSDQNGLATTGYSASQRAGIDSITVTIPASGDAVILRQQVTAGQPILAYAQVPQAAVVGQLAGLVSVRVHDAFDNPIAGAGVSFTAVVPGAGSVGVQVGTAVTDPAGLASFAGWRMGNLVGRNCLTASAPGFLSAETCLTSQPDAPAVASKTTGEGQQGVAGSTLPVRPSVRVTDRFGNPIPGTVVTFTIGGAGSVAGGTLGGGATSAQVPVGPDGEAVAPRWTLSPTLGVNQLTASVAALPDLVFAADGFSPVVTLTRLGSPGGEGVINQIMVDTFRVVATNAIGQRVPYPAVTWTVGKRGRALDLGSTADGVASAMVILGDTVDTTDLIAHDATGTSVAFPVAADPWLTSSAGVTHHCAQGGFFPGEVGLVWCWGAGSFGINGPVGNTPTPRDPVNPGLPLHGVATSLYSDSPQAFTYFVCGLASDNRAWCWGANDRNQLGGGTGLGNSATPVPVSGGHQFQVLAAGEAHACGLTPAGEIWCWGANARGQLGTGDRVASATPVRVTGGLTFSAVAAGGNTTCGVSAGQVYCWGYNSDGELGDSTFNDSSVPLLVQGATGAVALTVGTGHVCLLRAGGAAFCWGYYGTGTGVLTLDYRPTPVAGGLNFASIDAGYYATCGVTTAGAAYCWGYNLQGQLGLGDLVDRGQPVPVAGGLTFRPGSLTIGIGACGAALNGDLYCWGSDTNGELGDGGGFVSSSVPVKVRGYP